jgi:hypothetical protein
MTAGTPFSKKCEIMAHLFIEKFEEFEWFLVENDLGLPIAYLIDGDLIKPSEKVDSFVNDTWERLLAVFNVDEDRGFDSWEDLVKG